MDLYCLLFNLFQFGTGCQPSRHGVFYNGMFKLYTATMSVNNWLFAGSVGCYFNIDAYEIIFFYFNLCMSN